jgi:cytochrome oxidase Cu insertion factor (SCO1/SenC/PrrC family)
VNMTKPEAVTWGVVAAALAGVVALAAMSRRAPKPAPTDAPPAEAAPAEAAPEAAGLAPEKTSELFPEPAGELGDHPCVERSGRAMNTSELRGKFVVADFIFTSCAGTCPAMSAQMEELQKLVKGRDDVRLVSMSVDPERDTTKAMSEYADRYHADKDQWLFLRFELPVIQEIAVDRLRLVPTKDDLFMHSSLFALLDREGKYRGLYSALKDPKWTTKLLADLETLRGEPAK